MADEHRKSIKHRKLARTPENTHCDNAAAAAAGVISTNTPTSPPQQQMTASPSTPQFWSSIPMSPSAVATSPSLPPHVIFAALPPSPVTQAKTLINSQMEAVAPPPTSALNMNRYPSFSIQCSSVDQHDGVSLINGEGYVDAGGGGQKMHDGGRGSSHPPPYPPPTLPVTILQKENVQNAISSYTQAILVSPSAVMAPSSSSLPTVAAAVNTKTDYLDQQQPLLLPQPHKSINKNIILVNPASPAFIHMVDNSSSKMTSPAMVIPKYNSKLNDQLSSSSSSSPITTSYAIPKQHQKTTSYQVPPIIHYATAIDHPNFLNTQSLSTPSSLSSSKINLNETTPGDYIPGSIFLDNNNPQQHRNVAAVAAAAATGTVMAGGVVVVTRDSNCDASSACDESSFESNAIQFQSTNPFYCDTKFKRDEFLKATMRICLVVSPPTSKLTSKSKSLTHLDQLNPDVEIQNEQRTEQQQQQQQHQQISPTSGKMCLLVSPTQQPPTSSITQQLTTTTTAASLSSVPSPSSSTSSFIKKKSSSFLHRNSTKKPMLTRSQVSSSEYFTVYFNLNNDSNDDKELIIPSTKGVTLVNALSSALSMRNLTFSQITISDNNFPSSAELGTGSYCGVVDENTDVGYLAGKMLIVTEKEGNIMIKRSHSLLKKAASVGTSKTPKLFSSVSTEDAIENLESSKLSLSKQPKQRWSSFLGIKNPQQNQLCELLNSYDKSSVPSLKTPQLSQTPEYSEAVTYLDTVLSSTWINFVDRSGMTDQETKIQSAIWELVATEADYIRALQTVTNLFLACLESVQAENLLIDVDQNKLFSNIRDICNVNIQFWSLYLYPMVKYSEKTSQPMCVEYLKNGFLSFAAHFAPYTKYCAEQSTCQNTCKELNSSNLLFTAYLAWCESRSECKRLRLADILVRPMQRLTKYSLLLIAIRKHLSYDETGCELMDEMIHSVEDFVCSVNSHLTTRQENERLKGIMARIEVYDVVDSINEHLDKMVKPYNKMFDLCEPMKGCTIAQSRHLFLEGDLKFKDNSSKVDVHCFLLTDILLICKPISKRGPGALKVIRQPFMTDKLVIQLKDNVIYCVYLNDFNTAVTAFSLQSSEAKNWHDSFIKVKHIYTRLKQGLHPDDYSFKSFGGNDGISIRKSPGNSSFGSKVPSSNNSVSGSVELNESKNVSVDHDKTNSFSSDEGSNIDISTTKQRSPQSSSRKYKPVSSNSLIVQPSNSLGQSLPNLNLNIGQNSINHSLLVPGTSNKTSSHSNHLLSPSHRGISYPPPSPPRATLQRTRAIHSVKNPPLMKTKNVSSQSSFSWTQSQQETTSFARPQLSEPNIHHHSTESEV